MAAIFEVNLSLLGVIILSLASLSIGFDAGVVMAGRSDSRGTVYHYVASGIWGGCFSLLAGIMTMMADSRLHPLPTEDIKKSTVPLSHKFHVVPFYRMFFVVLFIASVVGFLSAILTIVMSSMIIVTTGQACDYENVRQLWLFFRLFCYAGVASICLIPTAACLLPLHLIVIIMCIRTVRQPYWISSEEYMEIQRQSQATSINSLAQRMREIDHDDDEFDSPALAARGVKRIGTKESITSEGISMEMTNRGPTEQVDFSRGSQTLPDSRTQPGHLPVSRSISELATIPEHGSGGSGRHNLI